MSAVINIMMPIAIAQNAMKKAPCVMSRRSSFEADMEVHAYPAL